ncbi:SlyX family protein [Aliiglaciecola sp. 3_MG-2023]|uniref:SlyX family protein n=1 Tax=Aliiglaciecola sp. 3_MG-2023 TaxID=3062644 RepID=UPI0026E14F72|nr:SlyX family protein [Aliiglaciecola sp. 3_MG-2023]MDO6694375.1 SlyX family protein [Aliiglaciecola sp. 3_MG-2023]
MSTDLHNEIAHLQTQLAFQEDTIEQLNRALADQQIQIDKMAFQLKHMTERMKQIEPSNIADSTEEAPPPHY